MFPFPWTDSFTCRVCGRLVTPEGAAIVHRCTRCGTLRSNRTAADDNPIKLMSIALKPLASPPFPLERIRELAALMGGDGALE